MYKILFLHHFMKSGQKQVLIATIILLIFGQIILSYKRSIPKEQQKQALTILQALAKTQYDQNNPSHQELLQSVKKKFNVQDDWTCIGFQRKNSPVTDFRAFGLLSLHCLEQTEAHKHMTMFMTGSPICLPFAITYLNIGNEILTKMATDQKYLSQMMFEDSNKVVESFVFYVDKHILNFEKEWIKNKPQNIMTYNVVWNKYKQRTNLK